MPSASRPSAEVRSQRLAHEDRLATRRVTGANLPTKKINSNGDSVPKALGFIAFPQPNVCEPVVSATRPCSLLNRCTRHFAASHYRPPKQCQFAIASPEFTHSSKTITCWRTFHRAITILVLAVFLLAGFQMTAIGRFRGDHQGLANAMPQNGVERDSHDTRL